MDEALNIECPNCHTRFALSETLAGPLVAQVRREADAKVQKALQDAAELKKRAQEDAEKTAERERALAEEKAAFESRVNMAVATERLKIQREEREKAEKELAPEREAERKRFAKLAADLKEAQSAELALRTEKEELDKREANLKLEVARLVDSERKRIKEDAEKEAEERARLKLAEKDHTIEAMREQIANAERKATQGSQQLQGDILELDFEATLRQTFPQDTIAPVKAGARGGDILQHVLGEMGRPAGTIFWEVKRTMAWGGDWIAKAKADAANAKAEVVVIFSEATPKGISDFGQTEGVWVVRPSYARMLATALRHGVISTAEARHNALGRETKAERLYEYMMGPEFRAAVEGIALPFWEIRHELEREKTATLSRWKRQEKRLERVLDSVAGLQGSLQGIGGMDMSELPGFVEVTDEE